MGLKMSVNFMKSKTQPSSPFPGNMIPYSQLYRGVVVHMDDVDIIDDGNTHIYFNAPNSNYDQYNLTVTQDKAADSPPSLYVIQGQDDDYEEAQALEDFFKEKCYECFAIGTNEDEIMLEESSFKDFTDNITLYTTKGFDGFLRSMFDAMIVKEWRAGKDTTKLLRFTDEEIKNIMVYIDDFNVAMTDSDMNSKSLYNYQALEFIGDKSTWFPATMFFIEKLLLTNRMITPNLLTQIHQTFVSETMQAQIARLLNLGEFFNKKGTIEKKTYEDMTEALWGALAVINFKIRAFKGINYHLLDRFIRWIYDAYDVSVVSEDAPIAKFYSLLDTFTGTRMFKEHEKDDFYILKANRKTDEVMTKNLIDAFEKSEGVWETNPNDIGGFVKRFMRDVRQPQESKKIGKKEVRLDHFIKMTAMLENFIPPHIIRNMSNERAMSQWSDDTREEFAEIMKRKGIKYIINNQRIKGTVLSCWTVSEIMDDGRKHEIYNTVNYTDGDKESVLIDLIKGNGHEIVSLDEAMPEFTEVDDPQEDYLLYSDGKKYTLGGDSLIMERFISRCYQDNTGRYFVRIHNTDKFIDYSPRIAIDFEDGFNINKVLSLLDVNRDDQKFDGKIPGSGKAMYEYIGDHGLWSHNALLLFFKHGIVDAHQLTEMNEFYRSKDLKNELTFMINKRRIDGALISFDELVGRNIHKLEEIANSVYMFLKNDIRTLYPAIKRLEWLRNNIDIQKEEQRRRAQPRVKKVVTFNVLQPLSPKVETKKVEANEVDTKEAEAKPKYESAIRLMYSIKNNEGDIRLTTYDKKVLPKDREGYPVLCYQTASGETESPFVYIRGHNITRLKTLFAEEMLAYEKANNPNLHMEKNRSFASQPGYEALEQKMKFNGFTDWQLSYRREVVGASVYRRAVIVLKLFIQKTLDNGNKVEDVLYYSGRDIDTLIRQLE